MHLGCELMAARHCRCTKNGGRYGESLSFYGCSAAPAVFKPRARASINVQSAGVHLLQFLSVELAS